MTFSFFPLDTLVGSDNEPRGLSLRPLVFDQVLPIHQMLSKHCHFPATVAQIKGMGHIKVQQNPHSPT